MVVTGACAAISAIPVNEGILKREFPFSIVAAALLLIFSLFGCRISGYVVYGFLVGYVVTGHFACVIE